MSGSRRRWWSSRSWAGCVWWLSSSPPCSSCWDGCSSTRWPSCGCGEPGRQEGTQPGSRSRCPTTAWPEVCGASCWRSAQAGMEDVLLRPGLKACWPPCSPSSPSGSTGRGAGSKPWMSRRAGMGWVVNLRSLYRRRCSSKSYRKNEELDV